MLTIKITGAAGSGKTFTANKIAEMLKADGKKVLVSNYGDGVFNNPRIAGSDINVHIITSIN